MDSAGEPFGLCSLEDERLVLADLCIPGKVPKNLRVPVYRFLVSPHFYVGKHLWTLVISYRSLN